MIFGSRRAELVEQFANAQPAGVGTTEEGELSGEARSLTADAFRRLRRNKAAVVSMVILAVLVLAALFG
ncbi:MAG: hypothetical protein AAFW76_08470, partial [Pseudomonadota bacterium]